MYVLLYVELGTYDDIYVPYTIIYAIIYNYIYIIHKIKTICLIKAPQEYTYMILVE